MMSFDVSDDDDEFSDDEGKLHVVKCVEQSKNVHGLDAEWYRHSAE